jgi:rare lipoprotein A (peptidoglycan hydrolase)
MPFIGGKFYLNPAYGRGVERVRALETVPGRDHSEEQGPGAHWVTIDHRHVLIREAQQKNAPQRITKQFSGEATYYNLPGKTTASGEKFDANKMAAAMTGEKVM